MMFVFGEVQEPLDETSQLVEDITRSQIIETIQRAVHICNKRGSKFLSSEDLLFLIRHDRSKVNRLRMFLSWKDVRKNSKGGGETKPEDMMEEEDAEKPKVKKMKIKFSWDMINSFSNVLSDDEDEEEDEEGREAYEDQVARLKVADEVTKTMSKEEYIYYSDCRQASFTYKKGKRFRDWCNFSSFYENKAKDEIMEILGFLGYEIVSQLTETGLLVKKEWAKIEQEQRKKNFVRDAGLEDKKYLFGKPASEQTPLLPIHIQEGFRRSQLINNPLQNFNGSFVRNQLSLL
ncbi:Transcription initiation protein spt3 [Lobulomyces angularis]|nr:Transcription initiation protein spt3 [Lobulomyces angularis]